MEGPEIRPLLTIGKKHVEEHIWWTSRHLLPCGPLFWGDFRDQF